MARCVMCSKNTTGYYRCEDEKIPICFKHYGSRAFIAYLVAYYPDETKQSVPQEKELGDA